MQQILTHPTLQRSDANPLLGYISNALAPYSNGLDIGAVIRDSDVTAEMLQAAITAINCEFEKPAPAKWPTDKTGLVWMLADTMDSALENPHQKTPQREVLVSSSLKHAEPSDNSGVHVVSPKGSAIIAGSSFVSNRIMRAAKHAAGWESAFTLFKDAFQSSKKDKLQFLLDTLHEQYIEKRVANGLTYEEAERHCEKEYMSFAFHYKGRIDPFSGKRVLIKATKTFVDMSPQAATDLMTLASQADFPKKHADRLHKANRGPWDLCKNGSARFELTDAIHALRDAEIERQLQANGGDKERAEFAANGSYIGINQHFSNDITYTLYTRGAYDVARRAREQSQALAR